MEGQDRVHGRVVVAAERLERGRGVDVGRDPGPVVLGPGGLPEQVADVGAELAVGKLERDDLAVEVGPGAGGLADEDRLGLAADGGRGVLRGRERQPADDDEQRAAPADLRVPDQVVQQRLGEEGVAAAVPAQVDDEPAGRRSAMKANSRSQKAANGSAGWSATALYWK